MPNQPRITPAAPLAGRVVFYTVLYYGPLLAYTPLLMLSTAASLLPSRTAPLEMALALLVAPLFAILLIGLLSFLVTYNIEFLRRRSWIVPLVGWNLIIVGSQYISLLEGFQNVGWASEIPSIRTFTPLALREAIGIAILSNVVIVPWIVICNMGIRSFASGLLGPPEDRAPGRWSRLAASVPIAILPILALWAAGATAGMLHYKRSSALPDGPGAGYDIIYLFEESASPSGGRERLALYLQREPRIVYLKKLRYSPGADLEQLMRANISMEERHGLPFGHYLMTGDRVRFSLTNKGFARSNDLASDYDFQGIVARTHLKLEWCHSGCTERSSGDWYWDLRSEPKTR